MGAADLECSLLTAYLVVLTKDFQPSGELYLNLKPDDGNYVVRASAMAINKINLIEHDKVAITYSDARKVLGSFLREMSQEGKTKLIPVGHAVHGDIDFIQKKIYDKKKWESYASYRKIDTSTIGQYLRDKGSIPESVTCGLDSLIKYFGIPCDETKLHDAKVDTLLTIEVYKKMLDL